MRILLIHGPNLNLLGTRQPDIYGHDTMADVDAAASARAAELGADLDVAQRNGEGEIIDLLQAARGVYDGVLINPGGYSHTSVAIRDAIAAIELPTVEVHLSNPNAREEFRHVDLVAGACRGVVAGFGKNSYLLALDSLVAILGGDA
jgi:3-dehydroquinate dehydratase II